jgi:hypothetical protein
MSWTPVRYFSSCQHNKAANSAHQSGETRLEGRICGAASSHKAGFAGAVVNTAWEAVPEEFVR